MEAVIKIGGSLAEDLANLKTTCRELENLVKTHRILIVPGGGRFADSVRDLDQEIHLSDATAHKMAILAMDQFGLLLSDLMTGARVVYTLEGVKKLSKNGIPLIFLPSRLMFQKDPLEHSWDVTSDSIAAYVAGQLRAKKLILVTDVDGIFSGNPKVDSNARLEEELSVDELLKWDKRTSVDRFLPRMLMNARVSCYVVNGKYPERIRAILDDEKTVCTRILA